MTKRRTPVVFTAAPVQEEVEEEAYDEEEGDEGLETGVRAPPNTNFLGRLVRGVTTGNQRQIDTTNVGAAHLVSLLHIM